MGPALSFSDVDFEYPGMRVFRGLNIRLRQGEFVCVLGPNGCGKTTMVRLATRVLEPECGRILLSGDAISGLSRREIARRVAVVPQEERSLFEFSVLEAVLMGRTPWLSGHGFEGELDIDVAIASLVAVEADHLRDRDMAELSGGESQRVLLARALAQKAPLLVLDEPTSHLDLKHRVAILRLLHGLRESEGLTVMVISHDVNLASRFADRLLLMAEGAIVAEGPPREVLDPEVLTRVYGTPVSTRKVEGLDVPLVFPE